MTHVKAGHILVFRDAVTNIRHYYGLPAYGWARTSEILSGRTQVRDWPFHIMEFRAAIDGVIDRLNHFDGRSAAFDIPKFEWIPHGAGRPRADVMNQLRDVILSL